MRLSIILLVAFLGLVACAPKWHQLSGYTFEKYVTDFKKVFKNGQGEVFYRRAIFLENLAKIIAHNNKPNVSYKKGVNQFTDMSLEEFKAVSLGHKNLGLASADSKIKSRLNEFPETLINYDVELPSQVDWRKAGVVSPIKDQGRCGGCWAFSSTGVLESHAAIAAGKGQLKTLSVQQLISCTPNPLECGGEGGCQGAVPELAYSYVSFYGLTSEFKYPYGSYYSGQTDDCTLDASSSQKQPEIRIDGFSRLPVNNLKALLAAVSQRGPISVSIDASNFHSYEQGIFSCGYEDNININHDVNLVGYGTDPEEGDFWLVRNSWGTQWGEDGYIRVRRENTEICGLDSTPEDGSACIGQTEKQVVCGQCGILSGSTYPLNVQVVG